MAFNSLKVQQMVRNKGIKAREYFAYVYPDRSGNASFQDIGRNDNPKAETIERIADLLPYDTVKVSITVNEDESRMVNVEFPEGE